jgi:hypothetical protein
VRGAFRLLEMLYVRADHPQGIGGGTREVT